MTMRKGNAGGVAYVVQGAGPPLVLLRGLGRSVKHWLGYDRQLAAAFTVITLDLRGIAKAPPLCTWTTSVFDMAADVIAVLDDLKLETAHIAGISLGGMVTLATGITHPERCRSLVVMNTSIAGQRTMRITPGALAALGTAALTRGEEFHHRLVESLVGSDCPPARRAEVARQYAEIAALDGLYIETTAKQLVAAARFLVRRRLLKMRVPTLVVYGTADGFVPNSNSQKLAELLPSAKLVAIRGGGHELSIDKGDELAAVLKDWVAGQELSSAR